MLSAEGEGGGKEDTWMGDLCMVCGAEGTCSEDKLDCEQSRIFLCKATARET